MRMDMTRLGFLDNTFDLIICSHVLEHVKDDRQAIKEMFRVLKSGGLCFILMPLDDERASTIEYERPNPLDPGHLRAYGLDTINRTKSVGFKVEMVDLISNLNKDDVNHYRLGTEEIYFLCIKSSGVEHEL